MKACVISGSQGLKYGRVMQINGSLALRRNFSILCIAPGLASSPWTAHGVWVGEAKVCQGSSVFCLHFQAQHKEYDICENMIHWKTFWL